MRRRAARPHAPTPRRASRPPARKRTRSGFEAEKQRFAQEKAAAEAGNDALDERITLGRWPDLRDDASTLRRDPPDARRHVLRPDRCSERPRATSSSNDPTHFRTVQLFARRRPRAPKALRDESRRSRGCWPRRLLQLTGLIATIGARPRASRIVARVCGRIKEEEDEREPVVREPGSAALNDLAPADAAS